MFPTLKNFLEHSSFRTLIRGYYPNAKVVFKKPSNGTVRFNVQSKSGRLIEDKQGFYRVRTGKSIPLSASEGESFTQVHFGRFTFAEATEKKRTVWNFSVSADTDTEATI